MPVPAPGWAKASQPGSPPVAGRSAPAGVGVRAAGGAVLDAPGLHARYLIAGRLLAHIPPHHYPGHALACRLY
ncbi:hypothetical protein HW844_44470, partial [Streptomyces sp. ND05-13A]|nr:hypothetical protein [Streptomyces caniscabiei]